ncbi:hypothetical protein V496_00971 [Pseudogymnoascus sp. VKM F-4515 (FW-2607)]|nr:hypothetical protein V496_00971 [Pseudogymnoascus sp. VKM F-4515 (FW-2607)]KFY79862.1 hypothetical protein V498_08885 [Pseudogymnoascus sp. VKM F-4517 (FW-2822)]
MLLPNISSYPITFDSSLRGKVRNISKWGPDGILHVFDLSREEFSLGEVRKTCGEQNLYYNANDTEPMRIENLFSDLESKTGEIFTKIHTAVTNSLDHIDILEMDIHILFKFMNLSMRRSKQYRDDIKNPYRENDFMFQRLFEASRKSGQSSDPGQFWLDDLLYLLETNHENLLADASKANKNPSSNTYKHFTERYALQIWKAADGYEFFLNERLVDFEGDTQSFLGTEVKETGSQLIWMTTEDLIHLILPISPEVAVVFCNESRCWDSPFAEIMHQAKIPYPQNSLLKNAPHRDISNVYVPSRKRGKKTWPATIAWRVSIGTLSRDHHRIIASYSLGHANSFVVVQRRARFERAKQELEMFGKTREEAWKAQGFRCGSQATQRHTKEEHDLLAPSQERITRIVDNHMSALEEIINIISTTHEPLQRTKANMFKSWLAIRACKSESYVLESIATSSSKADSKSSHYRVMHPALKISFEAVYPPQHPDHRDLITISFGEFFNDALGEEMFAQLITKIDSKIAELVRADTFKSHWEEASAANLRPSRGSLLQGDENISEQPSHLENDFLKNPAFQSVIKAAESLDVLKWMFEERQDILATFVRQIAVPMEAMQPGFPPLKPSITAYISEPGAKSKSGRSRIRLAMTLRTTPIATSPISSDGTLVMACPRFLGDTQTQPSRMLWLQLFTRGARLCRRKCRVGESWRSACWARLNNTDEAYSELRYAIDENFASNGLSMYSGQNPPFQIDANFGIVGAMICMLVVDLPNSDTVGDRTVVLGPAIPATWGDGSVKGLRLRGGGQVDFTWDLNGLVLSANASAIAEDLQIVNREGTML